MPLAALPVRLLPSLAAAGLYAVLIVLWHTNHAAYEALLNVTAFQANPMPYNDLDAILRAAACAHQGVNVYAPSACMGGGVYNYSPFFLHLGPGPGPSARFTLGLAVGALFLIAAALLPPARGAGALAVRAAALCSGAVIWALETANLDVVLFCLAVVGLWLVLAGRVLGFAGYALFALGGALKFYPAVLLALSLRERCGRFALIAASLAVAGVLFLMRYGQGAATALAMLPRAMPFHGVFGALDWPFGLVLLRFSPVLTLEPSGPQYAWAMHQPGVALYLVIASQLLLAAGLYAAYRLAASYEAPLAALPEAERLFLVAGALICAFCFFTAQNLDYRAIFLLLTLPALQVLPTSGWLRAAILLLLWEGACRYALAVCGPPLLGKFGVYPGIVFWMLREYAWWFTIVRLTAIAIAWLRASLGAMRAGIGQRVAGGAAS
jgi:hypothetical protein